MNIIHNSISSENYNGDAYGIYLESNSSMGTEEGTGTGIYLERSGGTVEADIGGGSLGSEGNNSIYDNETADIEHNLGERVKAENNWWGSADPTPVFIGDVDYIPYLTFDPND